MREVWIAAALASSAPGQEPVSFQRDIEPMLVARCQGCHQPAKAKGDVRLTSHGDLIAADLGLVVPGDPGGSFLLDVVTSTDGAAPAMPPKGEPLTDAEVATLKRWIEEGAVDDSVERPNGLVNDAGEPIYFRPPVITALAYSPDGDALAVSGRSEVVLRDASEPSDPIARLVGLSERIESIAFSPDGAHLAAAGGTPALRGELQVWDVAERTLALSKIVSHDTVRGTSWSNDGTRVAFGCTDNTVRTVTASNGEQVLQQLTHTDWVLGTTFSSDDSHLVTVSRDRSMKLIKVETQQFIDDITSITPGALRGGLMSVERRPGGDELLVGGADGVPKTYRMYREKKRVIGDDFNLLRAFEKMPGRVFSVDWSADGSRFVCGASLARAGTVRVYGVDAEAPLWSRSIPSGVYSVAFRPGADEVAAGGFDGVVRVFSAKDGELVHEFVPVPIAERSWRTLKEVSR